MSRRKSYRVMADLKRPLERLTSQVHRDQPAKVKQCEPAYPEWRRLASCCLADIKDFRQLGKSWDTKTGQLVHIDRGASVLGVAHLDTVQVSNHFFALESDPWVICNAKMDDRLGVHVLLDLLPSMGVEVDVLLTDGEESAESTASHFESGRQYNWIFSFDRAGNDVVLYQYDSPELREKLEGTGFQISYGTFSDISWMGHLGAKGFNVGVGYSNAHSLTASADLRVTLLQAGRLKRFWEQYKDIHLPHCMDDDSPVSDNWWWSHREPEATWREISGYAIIEQPAKVWYGLCDRCFAERWLYCDTRPDEVCDVCGRWSMDWELWTW